MKRFCIFLACLLAASQALAFETAKHLQENFLKGLVTNDAEALAACYAKDAVSFPLGAMMEKGPAAVEANWAEFFASYHITGAELSDDHLETHGDTAIAWGIFTIWAKPHDSDEQVEMVGRYMDVARKIDDKWLYVADHASMPLPAAE